MNLLAHILLASLSTAALELLLQEFETLEASDKHDEAKAVAIRAQHEIHDILRCRIEDPCTPKCGHL